MLQRSPSMRSLRKLENTARRYHLSRDSAAPTVMNDTITPTYLDAESAPLLFSNAAAGKVRELIAEEGNPDLKLRVYISGGGCSGFQYGFTFDEARADDDFAVDNDGVTLLVDPLSLQYLAGAEIDYSESLTGAQFVIRNPNAKTTCGCGSSFTV
jgi:iron-sulfur cluster insertion protein